MAPHDSDTVENVKPAIAAARYFVDTAETLQYDFGAASHVGLRRAENQDHYLVLRRRRVQEILLTNMPREQLTLPTDEAYALAVADGMGGVGRGELASQLAIRAAWDIASRATSWVMKLGHLNTVELTERVEGFTHLMQQAFLQEIEANPQFGDSGTTWTAAYLVSTFAVVIHLGDSPVFLWRDGMMSQISRDHTVEQEFIAAGVAPEIAGKYRHMLTRCFGSQSRDVRPDIYHLRLGPADQLLLCTDGVTDMVPGVRIAQCLEESETAQNACEALVGLALAGGGRDNITAVLARARSR